MERFTDDAFITQAVQDYSDMILRIAFQYVRNRADAEDVMQNVFMSLLKQSAFTDETHVKAWLIRVAVNQSKDFLRKARHRKTVPFEELENRLTASQQEVLDEIQELPEKDRGLIYLYYYEGYTAKEIGAMFGKKEKAVLMRLSRARDKLKGLLESE